MFALTVCFWGKGVNGQARVDFETSIYFVIINTGNPDNTEEITISPPGKPPIKFFRRNIVGFQKFEFAGASDAFDFENGVNFVTPKTPSLSKPLYSLDFDNNPDSGAGLQANQSNKMEVQIDLGFNAAEMLSENNQPIWGPPFLQTIFIPVIKSNLHSSGTDYFFDLRFIYTWDQVDLTKEFKRPQDIFGELDTLIKVAECSADRTPHKHSNEETPSEGKVGSSPFLSKTEEEKEYSEYRKDKQMKDIELSKLEIIRQKRIE